MDKYYIHCSEWKDGNPSFAWFINDLKLFFLTLKKRAQVKNKEDLWGYIPFLVILISASYVRFLLRCRLYVTQRQVNSKFL